MSSLNDVKELGGKAFELPEGVHLGTLIRVINLGLQKTTWEGVEKMTEQLALTFELSEVLMDDGRPCVHTQVFSRSLSEKSNLRKALVALIGGSEEDLKKLIKNGLGSVLSASLLKTVQLNIGKTASGKSAKITGFMALPKSLKDTVVKPVNESYIYDDPDNLSEQQLDSIKPNWVKETILKRI